MSQENPEAGRLKSTPNRAGSSTNKRGTPSTTGRLQSFRTPRDLTLGGTTKRTYSPTIPVRRIKEEPKDATVKSEIKKEGGQTRSRGRGRGRDRGRGRGHPDIIKSSSIFSEGPGAKPDLGPTQRAPSYGGGGGEGGGGDGGGGGGGSGGFFSESSKSAKSFDASDPDKILKMLNEDGKMDIDEDQLETGMLPIQLPLAFHDRIKEEEEDKDTPLVKVEAMDTDEKKPFVKPATMPVKKKPLDEEQMTCERLFKEDKQKNKEQLLFFQFPDSLPTKVFENTPGETGKKSLRLQDISEGYIGKVQVHKSGRTRLILGGVALDVSMGTPCNFLQDLVSIHTNEDEGSMLNLGHVKQRLVCTPDFEELLKGDKIT